MTATASPRTVLDHDRYRLRDGVYSAVDRQGRRRLVAWPRATAIGPDCERLRQMLSALSDRPLTRAEVRVACRRGEQVEDAETDRVITRLYASGWLARTVTAGERRLYTVHPWSAPPDPMPADSTARLSRFALLHSPEPTRAAADQHKDPGHQLVLERPNGWCEIRIHDPSVAAVIAGGGGADLPPGVVGRLRDDLAWAGMTVAAGAEDDFSHRQWSAHELWFHDRSRLGRRGYLGDGFGGTFWARGQVDPLPLLPEPYPGQRLALERPDLGRLRAEDPGLTTILEDRRSIREHDPTHPITLGELGEFLYRSCRLRDTFEADGVRYGRRPYPSGGSVAELEVYPLITAAEGVQPGLYHYDSARHELVEVADPTMPSVQRLLRVAGHSTVSGAPPQVLIMIAARAGRLMWKYEGMAYALMLKHSGVLVQTMYCVATAMRLAPCGLGSGDSVGFAEATGRDSLDECPVGEFALGRALPRDRPEQDRHDRRTG